MPDDPTRIALLERDMAALSRDTRDDIAEIKVSIRHLDENLNKKLDKQNEKLAGRPSWGLLFILTGMTAVIVALVQAVVSGGA